MLAYVTVTELPASEKFNTLLKFIKEPCRKIHGVRLHTPPSASTIALGTPNSRSFLVSPEDDRRGTSSAVEGFASLKTAPLPDAAAFLNTSDVSMRKEQVDNGLAIVQSLEMARKRDSANRALSFFVQKTAAATSERHFARCFADWKRWYGSRRARAAAYLRVLTRSRDSVMRRCLLAWRTWARNQVTSTRRLRSALSRINASTLRVHFGIWELNASDARKKQQLDNLRTTSEMSHMEQLTEHGLKETKLRAEARAQIEREIERRESELSCAVSEHTSELRNVDERWADDLRQSEGRFATKLYEAKMQTEQAIMQHGLVQEALRQEVDVRERTIAEASRQAFEDAKQLLLNRTSHTLGDAYEKAAVAGGGVSDIVISGYPAPSSGFVVAVSLMLDQATAASGAGWKVCAVESTTRKQQARITAMQALPDVDMSLCGQSQRLELRVPMAIHEGDSIVRGPFCGAMHCTSCPLNGSPFPGVCRSKRSFNGRR